MAKKSRYKAYLEGVIATLDKEKRKKEVTGTKSVLGKIKKLKDMK